MAIKPRKPVPEVGELVVGTVREVYDYGAYLDLDEYGGARAFLPWSEIASRMVRNIRQAVRENQKVVVKVIRVHRKRGRVDIDVSLKRVTEGERRRKMMWWKRTLKAANILERVAEKIGRPIDEAYQVLWKLDETYGDAMTGLEQAVIYGEQALREAGIPEEWIKPLLEEARAKVEVRQVKISGVLTLSTLEPDGVERIKQVLIEVRERAIKAGDGYVRARVYTIGAPRYRIDLYSHDYRIIEDALSRALEAAEDLASDLNVSFAFERIKE